MTARNVDQVVARRPYPRRDGYPAVPGEFAARLEAAGLRRRASERPADKPAETAPERRMGWTRPDHRRFCVFVGPNSFGRGDSMHRCCANEFASHKASESDQD